MKRFKILGIGIEHLQCFKAEQFEPKSRHWGDQSLALGGPRLSQMGSNMCGTGTSFLEVPVPGPFCQSMVVPGATFGHNFSLCRPRVLDCVRSPPASRPSLLSFSLRINATCKISLACTHAQLALFRAWSNGWFTIHRPHTENDGGTRLPCILGCEDGLIRYKTICAVSLSGPFGIP